MRQQDREMFNGEWKFKAAKYSNYENGAFKRDEWRINREAREGQLTKTMRVCDFFGTRSAALRFADDLTTIFKLRSNLSKLRKSEATFKALNAELLVDCCSAKSNLATERETVEVMLDKSRELATHVDNLKDALRNREAELKLLTDERDARIVAMNATNLGLARDNQLLAKRVAEAEALIGRVVIKRDRRSRP